MIRDRLLIGGGLALLLIGPLLVIGWAIVDRAIDLGFMLAGLAFFWRVMEHKNARIRELQAQVTAHENFNRGAVPSHVVRGPPIDTSLPPLPAPATPTGLPSGLFGRAR